jgi:hypothetical protein
MNGGHLKLLKKILFSSKNLNKAKNLNFYGLVVLTQECLQIKL